MGTKTGRPRGRPKGAKNKRTAEREAATKEVAAQIQNVVGDAFEGDALAYLMSVYKDPSKPENVRIDAAKAAIRYERPAIAPVERREDATPYLGRTFTGRIAPACAGAPTRSPHQRAAE